MNWKSLIPHSLWIVVIVALLTGCFVWLQEHDARLKAEASVKQSEATIATLQQQIVSNNQAVASLQAQITANDAVAKQQIASLVALASNVKTTPQAVAAIPQIDPNIKPVAQSNGDMTIPAPQVIPLFQDLAQGKQDAVALVACQKDLATEQQIVTKTQANVTAEKAISAQKDQEIAVLKKKPSFWHRVAVVAKAVGVGIGIGVLVARLM